MQLQGIKEAPLFRSNNVPTQLLSSILIAVFISTHIHFYHYTFGTALKTINLPVFSPMAEIVGTVSAAVSLTTTTLHAVRILANDLSSIKDAPQTIANAKTELHNVQSVIESLQAALNQSNWQPVLSDITCTGNLEAALKACSDVCGRFHQELKKLLRHSNEGDLSRRDRFNVGFFAKNKVVAFISELNVCKSTISLALSGANLLAVPCQLITTVTYPQTAWSPWSSSNSFKCFQAKAPPRSSRATGRQQTKTWQLTSREALN